MSCQYDSFAHEFSATRGNSWPEFDLILPYIKSKDRVLDLGCGNGRFRKFLSTDLVPEGNYFGLDVSQKMLKIARDQLPHDHFFRGDFSEKFPFGDDNFEVVVAIAAFHHLLNKKHQKAFLSECARVLKPGGILFITTWKLPQKHFWPNILKGRFKNWIIPFGNEKHPRVYRRVSDKELKKLFENTGFEVLRGEIFRGRNYIVIGRKKSPPILPSS